MKNELQNLDVNVEQFQAISQDILKEAARLGADQAEVGIAASKGFSISVHDEDVEKVEYNQDKVVEIRVFFGNRTGSSSISDLRPDAVRAAVEAACYIAKFTDKDTAAGIADKSELAFNYPQLALAYPWNISVEKAIELALDCEKQALAYDKRIISAEEVNVATGEALELYANSNGFIGYYPHTRHEISCVLVAKDKEEMQRDFSYTVNLDPTLLQSINSLAKEAADKTVKRLGGRRLPTQKAPVIFHAEEARGLIGLFVSAISGGSLYRKSSFLVDHLGKKIFPTFMHMYERPHLERALGSAPFDNDGVATRENVFVQDGILRSYSLGVYSARKLGMKTTGNAGGIHNLIVEYGKKDFKQLLKTMGRGLLVTEMMGSGINLLTGDYSRGASGYWVEDGEIQYPVHEITVAGKLQDMFARIVDISNDVDERGGVRTGSILIEEMMIAGD